jgi:alkylation response protein AidB-like acyl-CoA dehydrogenase
LPRSTRVTADRNPIRERRIATAVGRYWVTKRGPAFTAEALECLGGNGYVKDSGMHQHYREAPLPLSIREASEKQACQGHAMQGRRGQDAVDDRRAQTRGCADLTPS